MEDFPSNSRRPPAEPKLAPETKKIERVTEGEAIRRKKSLGKRFKETFFGGDTKGVFEYIMLDVLVPAAKDTITEAASQGVERIMYGEVRSNHRRGFRSGGSSNYTPYNRYSPVGRASGRDEERRPSISRRARANHDFDEIILESRVEATEVIDRLFDLVSKYEAATVADLYELVGISGNFQDEKWGWTDIRGAGVSRVRGGYLLNLPDPEPLRD